jgi:DNA-binding LytR/AlgR family response regulator
MLRILIVDDEPIARRYLTRLVEETDGASLVAVAPDGESALASLAQTPADVAFIDIRMPGMSGLELVEQIAQSDAPPAIVFTTAHDDHALAAFELGAVDYLLKPFGANRFHVALGARLEPSARKRRSAPPRRSVTKTPRSAGFWCAPANGSSICRSNWLSDSRPITTMSWPTRPVPSTSSPSRLPG